MAETLRLEVVTPQAIVFSEDVDMVTFPGIEGQMGVYPQHVPLITMLVPGEIIVNRWIKIGNEVSLGPPIDPKTGMPDPFYDKTCSTPAASVTGGMNSTSYYCAYLSGQPGSRGTVVLVCSAATRRGNTASPPRRMSKS